MTDDRPDQAIPIIEERLDVSKAEAVTDRLRVLTSVEDRPVLVDEVLERGNLHVERLPVERLVDRAPEPRQDGDTLIVSIVEERLVIEKRLFVVEELRITRTSSTERVTIPETLRTMRAHVERIDPAQPTEGEING